MLCLLFLTRASGHILCTASGSTKQSCHLASSLATQPADLLGKVFRQLQVATLWICTHQISNICLHLSFVNCKNSLSIVK